MKMQHRLTLALCVMVLFTAVMAFGAGNQSNNTTDTNVTTVNETNANETNVTGTADITENASIPVSTTVEPEKTIAATETADMPANTEVVDVTDEPVEETAEETEVPASTPEQSPGFGIAVTIIAVLFAVYIGKKR